MASDTQIVDWFNITPATPIGLRRGYFKLPVFASYDLTWKGGSEIVKQYNYSAERAFVLVSVPDEPATINYALCVKYRVGNTVTRYKIWDSSGMLPQVEQYTNQVIKPNFCLECWSWENATSITSPAEILFAVGERKTPSYDLRSTQDPFYSTTEAAAATLGSVETLLDLPITPLGWWDGAGQDTSGLFYQDISGNNMLLAGTNLNTADAILPEFKTFRSSSMFFELMTAATFAGINSIVAIITPVSMPAFATGDPIVNVLSRTGDTFTMKLPGLTATADVVITDFTVNYGFIWEWSGDGFNTNYTFIVFNLQTGAIIFSVSSTEVGAPVLAQIRLDSDNSNNHPFLELVVGYWDGVGSKVGDLIEFFYGKYIEKNVQSTLSFDDSTKWLDNTADVAIVSPMGDAVTLTPAEFKDVVYLLNPSDGKYYAVTMTIVAGVPTLSIGDTPVTL